MDAMRAVVLAIGAACATGAWAQARDVVLRDGQVTERRLNELLGGPADGARSRGVPSPADTQGGSGKESRTIVPKAGDIAPPPRKSAAVLVTFETDSSQLTAASRRTLDEVARSFNNDTLGRFAFVVEGHADARGADDHNLRLSQARADAVRDYLVQRGVVASRLQTVGKGESEPMNTREIAAPENRRVTFVRKD